MSEQEQTQEGSTHPPAGEERTVTARFYADGPGEEPCDVLIDGNVYHFVFEQEKARLMLEEQDLRADLRLRFGEEAAAIVFRIITIEERFMDLEEDTIRMRLLQWLPQHMPVIDCAFCPDDAPLLVADLGKHKRCVLLG